jgi:hypothetical protein
MLVRILSITGALALLAASCTTSGDTTMPASRFALQFGMSPAMNRAQPESTTASVPRIVLSQEQASTLAQMWVTSHAGSLPELKAATVGTPLTYVDLDGFPAAYVFSIFRGGQDIGYIILTYEARDNPVVEFSLSPAPHLRCGDLCELAAARRGLRLAADRPIFLGPLDYFYEAAPPAQVENEHRRWLVPMDGRNVMQIPHRPAHNKPDETVTNRFATLDGAAFDPESAQMIYGVPDYGQFYGPSFGYDFPCYSGCTPTAATNLAHFWAAAGYPGLGDSYWPDTTASLRDHMETFCLGSSGTTWTHETAPGLVSFSESRGYPFDSVQYCWPTGLSWVGCDNREFAWQSYADEIDQCRPPLISLANHPLYGSHTVTGVGYDTSGGNYYIVHDNWSSTPREVWILHEDAQDRHRFLFPFIPPHTDDTPPESITLAPLPPYQAITRFDVSWSGTDTDPGIGSYDLEYRDGQYGEWQWWLRGTEDTSARLNDYVHLQGGHTYSVRLRARDKHCNTTEWSATASSLADADPPATTVYSQPRYRTETSFPVAWTGFDDASGIASYDIWSRSDEEEWLVWQEAVTTTSAIFTDTHVGGTYQFISLGTDRLGRTESKTETPFDTRVTIARHSVHGRILSNRERPVFQAQVSSPNAYAPAATDGEGNYALFFPRSEAVTLTVDPPMGPGTLPPLGGVELTEEFVDVTGIDLVIPPADNAIRNSHFEGPDLTADWNVTGGNPPFLTHQAHTGDHAVALGALPNNTQAGFGTPVSADLRIWTISQTVALPAAITEPTLSWFYVVSGSAGISDTLTVTVAGSTDPMTHTVPLHVTGWNHSWLTLNEAEVGHEVTVSFALHRPQPLEPLTVVLDEVTLGSGEDGVSPLFIPIVH